MIESEVEIYIGQLLNEYHFKLATAESCTGGLIGHRITNVAGSSNYYLGGVTAYAYEAKEKLLGVQHSTLTNYGAVSQETVLEMARGIRQTMSEYFDSAQMIGLSTTGIAGPGGGMPGKPVGLVWIGLSTPDGDSARKFILDGDRQQNKNNFAQMALQVLYDYLRDYVSKS